MTHRLLQLLSLESLLSSGSNAFPRSLHGNCPYSVGEYYGSELDRFVEYGGVIY